MIGAIRWSFLVLSASSSMTGINCIFSPSRKRDVYRHLLLKGAYCLAGKLKLNTALLNLCELRIQYIRYDIVRHYCMCMPFGPDFHVQDNVLLKTRPEITATNRNPATYIMMPLEE